MAFGLDIGSALTVLAGLSRKGGGWRLNRVMALPGFKPDPEEKPELYSDAPLGGTFRALGSLGVKAGSPAVLVPGRDVYYRFSPSSVDPRMIAAQVRLEADELGGEEGKVLAGWIMGCDADYAPAITIGLAREAVIDHFSACLRTAGINAGALLAGCSALFSAYKLNLPEELDEHVHLYANIGDDTTDIILVREGSLLYARALGIGVNDFVDRLLPEYGGDRDAVRQVLFRELDLRPSIAAENLAGDRGVEGGQEVASRLFQQIMATVMLAKGAHKSPQLDARKIVLSGPGAAIQGLRELMMHRTRKTVEVFDPLARVELDGLDEQSRETVESYRPALALAVGLARLHADAKAERLEFLPASVRKRRQFLHKSLFLYLAAACVLLSLVPLYLLTRNSAIDAEDELRRRQQGPLGRYVNASKEIAVYQNGLDRARKRADASSLATAPGRVSTGVLSQLASIRPDTARLRSAALESQTSNPKAEKDFKARTVLKLSFFIERKPGADPTAVKDQLREAIKKLQGVSGVEPGLARDNPEASGLDVEFIVVLNLEGSA
ncbi:MAG: pilus assembly protein PilM [Planctomycetes bacterium]|nr:pilus assembly protein PilM [Planctomycetota bacterium]